MVQYNGVALPGGKTNRSRAPRSLSSARIAHALGEK